MGTFSVNSFSRPSGPVNAGLSDKRLWPVVDGDGGYPSGQGMRWRKGRSTGERGPGRGGLHRTKPFTAGSYTYSGLAIALRSTCAATSPAPTRTAVFRDRQLTTRLLNH
ncbi:hypothetical protein F4559_003497 [Saccharothrix violaceirubra]|uniref:Uncharacterized protein n=1 Tax=Saccharothrix violaceirubra TaxID=413306 RepID=A0A7W7WX11_9PSEU|nr:hypothetical protein [Saccharothrix violaceirubra]